MLSYVFSKLATFSGDFVGIFIAPNRLDRSFNPWVFFRGLLEVDPDILRKTWPKMVDMIGG